MTELSVRDLCVDLGGRRVLTDVSLTVTSGELVGLAGPNGAGKTTLLRSILGLIPLAKGTVEIDGERGAAATRHVGYVPQRHEFAWEFPIDIEGVVMSGRIRQIDWLRRPKREDYAAVRAALERVELLDLRRRTVGELSGGQRQRVLIARALAAKAEVLLLDEPFTGVDMPTQELLSDLFRTLADEGVALIMTTHDLPAAMATCDRICMVNRRIVADAAPDELRDPELWMRTFGVSANSPLLASVGALPTAAWAAVDAAAASSSDACDDCTEDEEEVAC